MTSRSLPFYCAVSVCTHTFPPSQVLYYIHKLNHLNVTVSHLEETGVGKTVNALRHQGGKVGEKARGLVNKWKEMVTAEEEEEEEEDTAENEEEVPERAEAPPEARVRKVVIMIVTLMTVIILFIPKVTGNIVFKITF